MCSTRGGNALSLAAPQDCPNDLKISGLVLCRLVRKSSWRKKKKSGLKKDTEWVILFVALRAKWVTVERHEPLWGINRCDGVTALLWNLWEFCYWQRAGLPTPSAKKYNVWIYKGALVVCIKKYAYMCPILLIHYLFIHSFIHLFSPFSELCLYFLMLPYSQDWLCSALGFVLDLVAGGGTQKWNVGIADVMWLIKVCYKKKKKKVKKITRDENIPGPEMHGVISPTCLSCAGLCRSIRHPATARHPLGKKCKTKSPLQAPDRKAERVLSAHLIFYFQIRKLCLRASITRPCWHMEKRKETLILN